MKLQQKIAMGLCAFYLISVIGFAISMHFCSGKLSSVKFAKTAECGACKGDTKIESAHNCCKSTSIESKITDSHETGFKVKFPQNFGIELFLGPVISRSFDTLISNLFSKAENKAPPLSAVLSLHIYNCIFRN